MTKTEEKNIEYTELKITLKNGNTIVFGKDEWNDYKFTGSAIAVIDGAGAWKAIFAFSEVLSVELS